MLSVIEIHDLIEEYQLKIESVKEGKKLDKSRCLYYDGIQQTLNMVIRDLNSLIGDDAVYLNKVESHEFIEL